MKKFLLVLLFGMVVMSLAKPDFDFDDDDDDDDDFDDDDFFRFGHNSIRRNSFQPAFRFNSHRRSHGFQPFHQPAFQQRSFQQRLFQQPSQSFNSFRPSLRECQPRPQLTDHNRHEPPDETPLLTIVRFAPFTIIRQSATAEPSLYLYDSKHVAVLSRHCSTSEILDYATTMISTTKPGEENKEVVTWTNHPQSGPSVEIFKTPVKKNTHKTIRDFNPNPFLLSKKAVKTRMKKMKHKKKKTPTSEPQINDIYHKDELDSQPWLHFSNSPVNDVTKILGSRQMRVTNNPVQSLASDLIAAPSTLVRSRSSGRVSPSYNDLPQVRRTTSRVLGSRQLQLVERKKPRRSRKKSRKSVVRKVLKGRRKLTSAETRTKTYYSFNK